MLRINQSNINIISKVIKLILSKMFKIYYVIRLIEKTILISTLSLIEQKRRKSFIEFVIDVYLFEKRLRSYNYVIR